MVNLGLRGLGGENIGIKGIDNLGYADLIYSFIEICSSYTQDQRSIYLLFYHPLSPHGTSISSLLSRIEMNCWPYLGCALMEGKQMKFDELPVV